MRLAVWIASAALALCAGLAGPVRGQSATAPPPVQVPRSDQLFLRSAAEGGAAAVEAAGLALARSRSERVRRHAAGVRAVHERASEAVRRLAARKGVPLPGGPSVMYEQKLRILEASEGAEFDRRYAEEFGVDAPRSMLRLYRRQVQDGGDPDVMAHARDLLPTLQQQLQLGLDLRSALSLTP